MESPKFLAPAVPGRRSRCRSCRRHAASEPPNGWYSVSVAVPEHVNPRKYVWVGMFCSLACLAREMPVMRQQQLETESDYDHVAAI